MSQPPQGETPQGDGPQDAGTPQQPGQPPQGRPAPAQPPYPPQQGYPPRGYPQQGHPPQGYPQQGGYPPRQGPYPPQGYPGQPGQPGQPYGGQAPQGAYGYVGPAGPGGPAGPQPYGPGPGGPGSQPPEQQGKSRTGLFVLIGAVVLALVLVSVAVAVNRDRTPSAGGTSTGGGGGASAPAAATASDAVSGYLEAVAAGDATTAVSYAADPSSVNTAYLTPAVLAASAKAAPMTAVQVTPVDDPDATSVPVSYKLGSTAVSTSIDVMKTSDDVWKLVTVTTELDLTAVQEDGIPMLMNGAKVKPGTFSLLPGSYRFTTGQRNFDYGSHPDLLVRYPADYPDTSRVEPQISSKGKAAALSALQKSWKSCLRSDDPKPSGCPNRWNNSAYKFKNGTVTWTRKGSDPVKKPRASNYATYTIYSVTIDLALRGTCTSAGRTGTCTGTLTGGTALARAEYSGDKVKVTWQT